MGTASENITLQKLSLAERDEKKDQHNKENLGSKKQRSSSADC